jgi:hypothetical protein
MQRILQIYHLTVPRRSHGKSTLRRNEDKEEKEEEELKLELKLE